MFVCFPLCKIYKIVIIIINIVKMPPKKVKHVKKGVRMNYTRESLLLAVDQVRKKQLTATAASAKYNIPEPTIRARVNNKYADKKPGPKTVFSVEEEQELSQWIFNSEKTGFPLTKHHLLNTLKMICEKMNKKTPFSNNRPGRSWWDGFLKRHPQLATKIAENVNLSRENMTEEILKNWFNVISEFLGNNNLLDIGPERVFHCNETEILLNPILSPQHAEKGTKNVYYSESNKKENVTTLITGNAAGDIASTFILFNEKTLAENEAEFAPENYLIDYAENGTMTASNFYEYIVKGFEPWLRKQEIQRPVILYLDKHAWHLTLPLSTFCQEHKIVLIALPPNATQTPLDAFYFKTLKEEWNKVNNVIYEQSLYYDVKTPHFAPLLEQSLNAINDKQLLVNGFKKSGLFPFYFEAVEFPRIMLINDCTSEVEVRTENSENVTNERLQVLESIIPPEKLQLFYLNASDEWRGELEDKSLFEVWQKLARQFIIKTEVNLY